jgi:hypothetical protein
VTALCRELDGGLGPDGRRLMYAHMLPRKEFMLEDNDIEHPAGAFALRLFRDHRRAAAA